MALSYAISGFGLANAKTIGFSFMERTISTLNTSALESPRNTSAPRIASSKVSISRSVINCFFDSFRSVRFWFITPRLSTITIFSFFAPNIMYNFVHELAEAPAPLTTIFTFSIFLPCISSAFNNPAPDIIAVPC